MATSKSSPTPGETSTPEAAPAGPEGGLLDVQPLNAVVAPDLVAPLAGTEPTQEGVHLKDIEGVRFIGTSDVHSISVADLKSVGVEDPKGPLRWDSSNGKFIPKSEINAATLEWLLTNPNDFRAE